MAKRPAHNRKLRFRAAAAASLVLALFAGLIGLAPSAFAHHSEITGSTDCTKVVSWTASAWQTTDVARRVNNDVKVWYVLDNGPNAGAQTTVEAHGHFAADDNYQFSGTFSWPDSTSSSLTLKVQEQVGWGANENLAGISDARTVQVKLPTDCPVPGTPKVTTSQQCVDGDGTVAIKLENVAGNQAITFVVTDPRTNATSTKVVQPGGSATVTLTGMADDTYSIPVSADGKALSPLSITVNCDRPGTPKVSTSVECTDGDGTATVTLQNTGGDLPVTYTVVNPLTQASQQVTVAVGATKTVTFSGLPDGQTTIAIHVGDADYSQTFNVKCDRPGTPKVSTSVECTDGDGTATVTLQNTGGDLPVTYTVVNPLTQASQQVTVAVGATKTVTFSGLPDGQTTIAIHVGDADYSQTFNVKCDRPGTPKVDISTECSDYDGVVHLTLGNTAGDLPVTYTVTSPVDGTHQDVVVAPGDSKTVTFSGLADGSVTVPVKVGDADYTQTVTIDCDAPGTPAVSASAECTATGGLVTVTLSNEGEPGKAKPIVFVVTDPTGGGPTAVTTDPTIGTNVDHTVTVAPGQSDTVTIPNVPDGKISIPVTADGESLDAITIEVDCQSPAVDPVSIDCADGGALVTITNTGPTPVEVVVQRDDLPVATVIVPGATNDGPGSTNVLVPIDEDQTVTISVTANGEVIDSQTVLLNCVTPTSTTVAPTSTSPSSTTTPPSSTTPSTATVEGVQVTRAAATTLPVTGSSNTLLLVTIGGLLILAGGCFVGAAKAEE